MSTRLRWFTAWLAAILIALLTYGSPALSAPGPAVTSVAADSGRLAGGQSVVITGSGFTKVSKVLFGTRPGVGMTVRSSTRIEVKTPAQPAGKISVRVVTAAGTSPATAASQFTVIAPPVLTTLSPASGPVSGGATVTFTGQRFVGVTGVRFGSVPATAWTVTSAAKLTVTVPAGAAAGSVPVTVTTNSGSSPAKPTARYTYTAPVAIPTVTALSPSSGAAIGGESVTITGTRLGTATAIAFGSIPAPAFTVVNGTRIVVTAPPGSPGRVDVTVTTAGGSSAPGPGTGYTYVGTPPSVSALSPNSGPIAGGTRILISGSDFQEGAGVTIGGNPATEVTLISPTQLSALTPPGTAGPAAVVVSTAYGSSSATPADFRYVDVVGVTPVVVTGSHHSCRLSVLGAVSCWGWNAHGQLGDGSTTSRSVATPVAGLESGVIALAAGGASTCALRADETALCWGWNSLGQLGTGDRADRLLPQPVSALGPVSTISVGSGHACALERTGNLSCWGWNHYGQLGDGGTTDRLIPVPVAGLSGPVSALSAGEQHTCAVAGGGAYCWGAGSSGQLGTGARGHQSAPTAVSGLGAGVVSVSAGRLHTCAIDTTGLRCWGRGASGALGTGNTADALVPVAVTGLGAAPISVSTSGHSCVLAAGAWCWGPGGSGRLGTGNTADRLSPSTVLGLPAGVIAVSAGSEHSCALTASEQVYCWGENSQGQSGTGPE